MTSDVESAGDLSEALGFAGTGDRPAPKVNKGSPRMFESAFFERFSHVHPATPAVLFGPLVIVSLVLAFTMTDLGAVGVAWRFIAGYVGWTFFEYWLHRLVFHLPVVGPLTERLQFLIHGVHHDYPWDRTRLVIPTPASIVLALVLGPAFWAIFGGAEMFPIFAGFVTGYIAYDTIHWYVHARVPRSRFGRWVRREHMVHHFKDNGTRFGVSCPWLDHLFATTGSGTASAATADKRG